MSAADQSNLTDYEPDLSRLTPAEQEAFETVELQDVSGREYARRTDRSWGTVSNLLMRARRKLDVYPDGDGDG